MGLLDNIIGTLSPKAALNRKVNQAKMELLDERMKNMRGQRAFDGADYSRRTESWFAPMTSMSAEMFYSLPVLRARSSELVRNNAYARRAVNIKATYIVGSGIRPRFTDGSNSVEESLNLRRVKKAWKDWAETTDCDFDGHHNFYGLQMKTARAILERGDCIWLKRYRSNGFPYQIQVLEGDYIDHFRTMGQIEPGQPYTIQGVQYDAQGKVTGYWLWDKHPGDAIRMGMVSKLHKAEDVIHPFQVLRPGQVRGIPDGISAFIRMRDLDTFKDAELQKQITAACFGAFVESPTIDPVLDKNNNQLLTEKLEPGLIQYLSAGQKISFATPPAFDAYDSFVKANLQEIASAYDLPYELLSGDMSNVSYISGRLGLLPFGRVVEDWQDNVMIAKPCNRGVQWFLEGAFLNGDIRRIDDIEVSWTVPAKTIVDEAKATKSTLEAMEGGLLPPSEAARLSGMDFDDLVEMYEKDYAKINKANLKFSSDFSKEFELKKAGVTVMKEADTTNKV